MKRKISFLVATAMVLSMLPAVGVSAATANSVLIPGGTVASDYAWASQPKNTPFLMLKDDSGTPGLMGGTTKFTLTLENAEFDLDELDKGTYSDLDTTAVATAVPVSDKWAKEIDTLKVDTNDFVFTKTAPGLLPAPTVKSAAGYEMKILGPTVAEISGILTAASPADSITLPLPVKMKGTGPAKVSVGSVGASSFTEGTYTFAVGADGTAAVTIKDSTTTFASKLIVPDITVLETAPGTIDFKEKNQTIKFTAPNGFEWLFDGNEKITPYAGFSGTIPGTDFVGKDGTDEQVAVFYVTDSAATPVSNITHDDSKSGGLIFSKMVLIKSGTTSETPVGPVNVKVTVSGGGSHTITVGEFAKRAITLTAEDKALPEIVSGLYEVDPMDEDSQVLDVTIKETSANAWNTGTGTTATFALPDGVKFRAVEVKDASGITQSIKNEEVKIKYDSTDTTDYGAKDVSTGTYLALKQDLLTISGITPKSTSDRMELKLRCYVTVKPGFTGDILFKTDEDNEAFAADLSVVVGKAVNPFTVTAASKDVQLGYMNIPLNDIIIKENKAGALKKAGTVGYDGAAKDIELKIGGYQGGGIGFKEKGTYEVLSGDIVIDKLDMSGSTILVKVKRESSTASEVKISGMTMDADRSIPEGKLELRVAGSVVGNYNGTVTDSDKKKASSFDVDYFVAVPDYVNIITAAPDKDTKYTTEVAVVVGGKTITANGVETALETAPFNKDGYVMVPTRAVAVALGLKDEQILWNATTKEVTILDTNRNRTSQFMQGSSVIKQAGMSIGFEGPSCQNVDGRTFLPFRALGEIVLGCPVSWDQATQTAYFNKGAGTTAAAPVETATPAAQ